MRKLILVSGHLIYECNEALKQFVTFVFGEIVSGFLIFEAVRGELQPWIVGQQLNKNIRDRELNRASNAA